MDTVKRTENLISIDQEHLIHGFAPASVTTQVVFEEGHGMMLKDTEGKEYKKGGKIHCPKHYSMRAK